MKKSTFFADIGFLITKQLKLFEKIEKKPNLYFCVFGNKITAKRTLAGKNFF